MKLYHGTTDKNLEDILKNGLKPRGRRKGNWKNNPSQSKSVYLTSTYSIFYGRTACQTNKENILLIEVDGSELIEDLFRPDEDFLEQATRKENQFPQAGKSMPERTQWFRDHIDAFSDNWKLSLDHLGTVAYQDVIIPDYITKIVRIPRDGQIAMMSDPTITLMNYYLMKDYYMDLTTRAFMEGEVIK